MQAILSAHEALVDTSADGGDADGTAGAGDAGATPSMGEDGQAAAQLPDFAQLQQQAMLLGAQAGLLERQLRLLPLFPAVLLIPPIPGDVAAPSLPLPSGLAPGYASLPAGSGEALEVLGGLLPPLEGLQPGLFLGGEGLLPVAAGEETGPFLGTLAGEGVEEGVPLLQAHPLNLGPAVSRRGPSRKRRARILKDGQLTMIVYGQNEALLWAKRVATFQQAMREVLGDRRRGFTWSGSIIDSVVGTFLTQNVSDFLSSKAFMELASRFPAKQRRWHQQRPGQQDVLQDAGDDPGTEQGGEGAGAVAEEAPPGLQQGGCRSGPWDLDCDDTVDWEAVRTAHPDELADAIKCRGMHFFLARRIQAFLNSVIEHNRRRLGLRQQQPPPALEQEQQQEQHQVQEQEQVDEGERGALSQGPHAAAAADLAEHAQAPSWELGSQGQREQDGGEAEGMQEEPEVLGARPAAHAAPSNVEGSKEGAAVLAARAAFRAALERGQEEEGSWAPAPEAADWQRGTPRAPASSDSSQRNNNTLPEAGAEQQDGAAWGEGPLQRAGGDEASSQGAESARAPKRRRTGFIQLEYEEEGEETRGVAVLPAEQQGAPQQPCGGPPTLLPEPEGEQVNLLSLEWLRQASDEEAKEYLLAVDGLGRKSVACIMLLTLGRKEFPVDTNVGRICARLGWIPLDAEQAVEDMDDYAPEPEVHKYLHSRLMPFDLETLYELHYQMITLGKVFCNKASPNCRACPMREECEYALNNGPSLHGRKRQRRLDAEGLGLASSAATPPPVQPQPQQQLQPGVDASGPLGPASPTALPRLQRRPRQQVRRRGREGEGVRGDDDDDDEELERELWELEAAHKGWPAGTKRGPASRRGAGAGAHPGRRLHVYAQPAELGPGEAGLDALLGRLRRQQRTGGPSPAAPPVAAPEGNAGGHGGSEPPAAAAEEGPGGSVEEPAAGSGPVASPASKGPAGEGPAGETQAAAAAEGAHRRRGRRARAGELPAPSIHAMATRRSQQAGQGAVARAEADRHQGRAPGRGCLSQAASAADAAPTSAPAGKGSSPSPPTLAGALGPSTRSREGKGRALQAAPAPAPAAAQEAGAGHGAVQGRTLRSQAAKAAAAQLQSSAAAKQPAENSNSAGAARVLRSRATKAAALAMDEEQACAAREAPQRRGKAAAAPAEPLAAGADPSPTTRSGRHVRHPRREEYVEEEAEGLEQGDGPGTRDSAQRIKTKAAGEAEGAPGPPAGDGQAGAAEVEGRPRRAHPGYLPWLVHHAPRKQRSPCVVRPQPAAPHGDCDGEAPLPVGGVGAETGGQGPPVLAGALAGGGEGCSPGVAAQQGAEEEEEQQQQQEEEEEQQHEQQQEEGQELQKQHEQQQGGEVPAPPAAVAASKSESEGAAAAGGAVAAGDELPQVKTPEGLSDLLSAMRASGRPTKHQPRRLLGAGIKGLSGAKPAAVRMLFSAAPAVVIAAASPAAAAAPGIAAAGSGGEAAAACGGEAAAPAEAAAKQAERPGPTDEGQAGTGAWGGGAPIPAGERKGPGVPHLPSNPLPPADSSFHVPASSGSAPHCEPFGTRGTATLMGAPASRARAEPPPQPPPATAAAAAAAAAPLVAASAAEGPARPLHAESGPPATAAAPPAPASAGLPQLVLGDPGEECTRLVALGQELELTQRALAVAAAGNQAQAMLHEQRLLELNLQALCVEDALHAGSAARVMAAARRHYRLLSVRTHPDKCAHPLAQSAFAVLSHAFARVSQAVAVVARSAGAAAAAAAAAAAPPPPAAAPGPCTADAAQVAPHGSPPGAAGAAGAAACDVSGLAPGAAPSCDAQSPGGGPQAAGCGALSAEGASEDQAAGAGAVGVDAAAEPFPPTPAKAPAVSALAGSPPLPTAALGAPLPPPLSLAEQLVWTHQRRVVQAFLIPTSLLHLLPALSGITGASAGAGAAHQDPLLFVPLASLDADCGAGLQLPCAAPVPLLAAAGTASPTGIGEAAGPERMARDDVLQGWGPHPEGHIAAVAGSTDPNSPGTEAVDGLSMPEVQPQAAAAVPWAAGEEGEGTAAAPPAAAEHAALPPGGQEAGSNHDAAPGEEHQRGAAAAAAALAAGAGVSINAGCAGNSPPDSRAVGGGQAAADSQAAEEGEAADMEVEGVILVTCRTAMRGRFPLNGTYFQVNEVFADQCTVDAPVKVSGRLLAACSCCAVHFGHSIHYMTKGMSQQEVANMFAHGHVCFRAFEPRTGAPLPLPASLAPSVPKTTPSTWKLKAALRAAERAAREAARLQEQGAPWLPAHPPVLEPLRLVAVPGEGADWAPPPAVVAHDAWPWPHQQPQQQPHQLAAAVARKRLGGAPGDGLGPFTPSAPVKRRKGEEGDGDGGWDGEGDAAERRSGKSRARVQEFPKVRRGERCGWCHTCLNPQLKKACVTRRKEMEAEARRG